MLAMKQRVNAHSAELRAVEEGLTARLQPDGTFRVRSSTRFGLTWTVRAEAVKQGGPWIVRLRCTCESGTARPSEAIACLHGAAVARRLERMGWAKWDSSVWVVGVWVLTDKGLEAMRGTS